MDRKQNVPLALIILDGCALNPDTRGNAVYHASTPTLDALYESCPWTTLATFGPRVGLPDGQMGNSEVGHLNIGGGRVVQQELTRINFAVERNEIAALPEFVALCDAVKSSPSGALHLIGLASEGGVHSSLDHLKALLSAALTAGVSRIYVHAITDGRDRPPTASIDEVGSLVATIEHLRRAHPGAEILLASICGRYYAMDRDNRWERTERAYDLYTAGSGTAFTDPIAAIRAAHAAGTTDEFLEPMAFGGAPGLRSPWVSDGDALLFFNFRADRMRQLVGSFVGSPSPFDRFARRRQPTLVNVTTLTEYEATLPVQVLFRPTVVKNHLGEVLARHGLTQLRIAETEKYAHVTYFFSGGVEEPVQGEERVLIPSPRDVKTYDLKPEMSAYEVTARLIEKIESGAIDVFICNFANCDMVGHTGSFDAAVKAVQTVDSCLGKVLDVIRKRGGVAVVTADHGNADQMIDYATGEPHTFHTLHPVPLIIVGLEKQLRLRSGGALCDIAPTILALLGIPQPAEMTGRSLIET